MKRVALGLWIAWAVVVWIVVFDHAIEIAGRRYLQAAGLAAQAGGPYARLDDWMRPAVTGGLWSASAAAGTIVAVGLLALRYAARGARLTTRPQGARPCA